MQLSFSVFVFLIMQGVRATTQSVQHPDHNEKYQRGESGFG